MPRTPCKNAILAKALIGAPLVYAQTTTLRLDADDIPRIAAVLNERGYRIVRIKRRRPAKKGR